MPHQFEDRIVTARKDHICSWCAEKIAKGELAQYRAYVGEDGPQSDWMHIECYEAMGEMDYDDLDQGWYPGDFIRGSIEYA